MIAIVVFNKGTRKVIFATAIEFVDDCNIKFLDSLVRKNIDFEVFVDREPVFYKDDDDDICLRPNCYILYPENLI